MVHLLLHGCEVWGTVFSLIRHLSETQCFVWIDRAANICFILFSRPEDQDRQRTSEGEGAHWTTSIPGSPFHICDRRNVAFEANPKMITGICFFFFFFMWWGAGVSALNKTPGAPEILAHSKNYNTAYAQGIHRT